MRAAIIATSLKLAAAVLLACVSAAASSAEEHPICACEPGNPSSICVRAAYPHKGQLVVMAELPKEMVRSKQSEKNIFCYTENRRGRLDSFKINVWTHHARSTLTHSFAKILCPWQDGQAEDLEQLVLFAQPDPNAALCKIPLQDVLRLPPNPPQPYRYKLCAMTGTLFNQANFLDEWLQHQQTIGVQHVTAYIVENGNDSIRIPTFQQTPLFQDLVASGYVTVVQWDPLLLPSQIYHRSQHLAYMDYLFRFRGLCEWTEFADTDDFFVDFRTGHNLTAVVQRHEETAPNVNVIRFCWKLFLPDCGRIPDVPLLESLMYANLRPENTKHITRTIDVTDTGIHKVWEEDRHYCGQAEMWHLRHGFPAAYGQPGSSPRTSCETYPLPPNFYDERLPNRKQQTQP